MDNSFDVFISYDTADKEIADYLKEFLDDLFLSNNIYVSASNIEGGKIWFDDICRTLKSAKVVIVLISDISVKNHWLYFEAGAGINEDKTIPFVLDNIGLAKLPPPLCYIQARECSHDGIKKLISDISKRLGITKELKKDYGIDILLKDITKNIRCRSARKLSELVPGNLYAKQAKNGPWVYKENCIVYDYIIEKEYKISIDIYFHVDRCEIQLFQREDDSMSYLYDKMCTAKDFLPRPLNEYDHASRLIYKKFKVNDEIEQIANCLIDLLKRIEKYIEEVDYI